eukprot:jgi/Ulvmu1/6106/UM027_0084.1
MLMDEGTVLRKLNWAILPITCIMVGCCYLDRSNVAYMQLQLRRPPPVGMGFSPSLYGNASGLFFLSYSLFQIPSSIIVAKVGAPLLLAIIVILWGVSAMLLAGVQNAAQFLVLRLLLGAFEAGTFPCMWYHMTLFYPTKDLTLPMSATASAIMAAQVLSSPAAAALMSLHGAAGLHGWQWIALVEGGVTVVVGVALKLALPAAPASMRSLSPAEQAWISAHVGKQTTAAELVAGLRTAATSCALWQLTAVVTAKSFAVFSLIFWIPLVVSDLLHRSGHSSAAAGTSHDLAAVLLTAVPYAFAAVASYAIGWSSHAWDERKAHTYVPFGIAAALLLAAPLLQGPEMAVPAFVALTVALCLSNNTGPVTASVAACLPPEARSGGLALYNSVAGLGGYLGPAAFGWLKDATGSNAPGMAVNGFVLMLGGLLMWAFDERAATACSAATAAAAGSNRPAEDQAQLLPAQPLQLLRSTGSVRSAGSGDGVDVAKGAEPSRLSGMGQDGMAEGRVALDPS